VIMAATEAQALRIHSMAVISWLTLQERRSPKASPTTVPAIPVNKPAPAKISLTEPSERRSFA